MGKEIKKTERGNLLEMGGRGKGKRAGSLADAGFKLRCGLSEDGHFISKRARDSQELTLVIFKRRDDSTVGRKEL
jgi:hypothetical protein